MYVKAKSNHLLSPSLSLNNIGDLKGCPNHVAASPKKLVRHGDVGMLGFFSHLTNTKNPANPGVSKTTLTWKKALVISGEQKCSKVKVGPGEEA